MIPADKRQDRLDRLAKPERPNLATSSKWWRQVGYWALTIQITLGLPALFVIPVIWPETNLTLASSAYMAVLAAWVAAAGIRQWGKNKGKECYDRNSDWEED